MAGEESLGVTMRLLLEGIDDCVVGHKKGSFWR